MEKCNYIDNKWIAPENGKDFEAHNPADVRQVVFKGEYADTALAVRAICSAYDGWPVWKKKTIHERITLLRKLIDLLHEKRENLARVVTLENGKLLGESIQEVEAAVSEGKYQLDFIAQNSKEIVNGHEIRYEPVGPVLLITPWNFPITTVLRKLIPAMVVGNTVVVKASENTPMSSVELFKIIELAGFPKGAVNLLNGYGAELVPPMIDTGLVRAVSFTGSTATGNSIAEAISGKFIKYQAEMGGNNTVLLLDDTNLDIAIPAVVANSFACCGQWCTGTGRIMITPGIYNETVKRLKEAVNALNPGNGFNEKVTIGPLINAAQLDKVSKAVDRAKKEGAVVEAGGHKPESDELKHGNFYLPTLLTGITEEMSVYDEEIFGPVLTIVKVENAEKALTLLNKSPFGLTFSLYTSNLEMAEKIVNEAECGLVHINLPTTYRDLAMPLLGWKDSGFGMPESGRFMRDFFTRTKAIYKL